VTIKERTMTSFTRKLVRGAAAGVALMVGSGATAWACLPSVGAAVGDCNPQDVVTESGASDIVGGSAAFDHAAGGGGDFVFNFVLADDTCSGITYRAEVYDAYSSQPVADGVTTTLTTAQTNGDGSSNSVHLTASVPASYDRNCVGVIVRTVNAAGATLDRAPDLPDQPIPVCDEQGPGQLWR
jgi:hypothetical protein